MSSTVLHPTYIATRYVRALLRQPYYVAVTLVQPVIWLLLFGQLFKNVTQLPGFGADGYITFLTPGVMVMTALYSSGWSGMGYIIDMDRGVMDRFLVAPVRRNSLLAGQLVYQVLLTLVQSLIIIGLSLLVGARFDGPVLGMIAFFTATVLLGIAMASFSNLIALQLRKQETVIAVVNLLVLPLSFLSSAFMPAALAPNWIRAVAGFNPVNWAVEVGHQALAADTDWRFVLYHLGYLLVLAIISAGLATRAFRSYQRSV